MNASNTSRKLAWSALGLAMAFGIAACGGSSAGMGTGQMTLAVGDAPVDGAQKVVVEFTGVTAIRATRTLFYPTAPCMGCRYRAELKQA